MSMRGLVVQQPLRPRSRAASLASPKRTHIFHDPSGRDGGSAIGEAESLEPQLEARLAGFVSLTGLPGMPLDEARRVNDLEAAVMFGPVEPVQTIENSHLPGPGGNIPVRIYRPDAERPLPLLVYFHGGGWVVGSLDSHDGVARFLANHVPCVVMSVDYRLGPEHRFPAAVEDAWAATSWACENAADIGGEADRLAVGGDSAGGNLAAVVARHARDAGLQLALQLLVYPALDCVLTDVDEESDWWFSRYLRTEADCMSPDASPLWAADLHGVAPALLLSCGLDPLKEQAEAYISRLREAGVRAEHVCFQGLVHGAFRMPAVLPSARVMLDASAKALKLAFGGHA